MARDHVRERMKTSNTLASTPQSPAGPATAAAAGVYVHFPWCLAKCPYCDFVSYATTRSPSGVDEPASEKSIDHAGYADAVLRDLDGRAPAFAGRRMESIFFGGGTPSLWAPRELGRVVRGIRQALEVRADVEITVECNPTSLDEDKARALLDAGVGRLSIGVQSLRDPSLAYLGRLHDGRGALAAIEGARRAGVPRISADLIFGLPGQSPEQARDEALELAALGLDHLSCYQLTIEPGTRFGELARRGRLPQAPEDAVAEAFLAIDEALTARGLEHYEISNYARPGQEARHNLGYWRGHEYVGLGCGAFGFALGTEVESGGGAGEPGRSEAVTGVTGVRWRNAIAPERYARGGSAAVESTEDLDAEALLRERIMLGLRTVEGVDLEAAAADLRMRASPWTAARTRAADRLEERGRVVRHGSRLTIPRSAWLWTDDTAARLF
jgi:oxygen-independent coproporphyrinogen-3 oxidase